MPRHSKIANRVWSAIGDNISTVRHRRFQVESCRPVSGGDINRAFVIGDGADEFFVKLNEQECGFMFEAEALGLREMGATGVTVPEALCWGDVQGWSYLVLTCLKFGPASNSGWRLLGRQLADMHRHGDRRGFGWHRHNSIGKTPQSNVWESSWPAFFRRQRLEPQLKMARERGGRFPQTEALLLSLETRLGKHTVCSSLLHGDLWSGNVGFSVSGQPVLFDPAVYYGDREADLAMTELFGGFPRVFYQAYEEAFPLPSGYSERKDLYNLYHVLNHFNLFGGGYDRQANRLIATIMSSRS